MRLYRILGSGWAGTQTDAKAAAKSAGVVWHETEVPTDKPGLLAWLNERNVPAQVEEFERLANARLPLPQDPLDDHQPEPALASVASSIARATPKPDGYCITETGAVVDFILERATIGQVETIFSALGSRFAEARRAA